MSQSIASELYLYQNSTGKNRRKNLMTKSLDDSFLLQRGKNKLKLDTEEQKYVKSSSDALSFSVKTDRASLGTL